MHKGKAQDRDLVRNEDCGVSSGMKTNSGVQDLDTLKKTGGQIESRLQSMLLPLLKEKRVSGPLKT